MPGAAEVHALLVRTLTKKRGSDVADTHHLGDGDAKHALDVIADGRNSAARFAAGHDVGQSERTWVGIALLEAVGNVLGERRGREERVGKAGAKSEDHPLRVTWRHRHRACPNTQQDEMRMSGHKRTGAECGQHAAVLVDAGRVIGPSAHGRPRLHVATCQRKHARTAGGAARLVHALDLVRRYAQVAAERRVLVKRLLQLLLGREGEI